MNDEFFFPPSHHKKNSLTWQWGTHVCREKQHDIRDLFCTFLRTNSTRKIPVGLTHICKFERSQLKIFRFACKYSKSNFSKYIQNKCCENLIKIFCVLINVYFFIKKQYTDKSSCHYMFLVYANKILFIFIILVE